MRNRYRKETNKTYYYRDFKPDYVMTIDGKQSTKQRRQISKIFLWGVGVGKEEMNDWFAKFVYGKRE